MKLEKRIIFGNIFVQSIQKNAHQGRSVCYNASVALPLLCGERAPVALTFANRPRRQPRKVYRSRRFNLAPEMG